MHQYRTTTCGALRLAAAGSEARLAGWVHRKRDHGQLQFIDLRDHYGVTQCVIDVSSPLFAKVDALRLESVISVSGTVVQRSPDTVNPKLSTGEVELQIKTIDVLSEAEPLPFPVNTDADYPEDMRLRYRFLDLRREQIHANIILRSRVIASIRHRMIEQGFTEFQTPILTADSPEGARPYFRKMRDLRDRLRASGFTQVEELSMGMSHDYPVAIEEGATMVRIGTALFGPRSTAPKDAG